MRRLLDVLAQPPLAVALLGLLMLMVLSTMLLQRSLEQHAEAELLARVRLLEEPVGDLLQRQPEALVSFCRRAGNASGTRLTVIAPDGKVLADSEVEPTRMDNHASRAEVIDALRDGTGTSTRYSFTLHEPLVYVAVRLDAAGAPIGVLRAAQPEVTVAAPRKIAGRWIVLSGVSFALLAVLMAGVAQRRRRAHLAQLTEAVERFAHGELGYKLPLLESGETEALALALNRMAQ
ncbi:MAG: HAMP domain-containing protein, partial [Planctomycetota bacterium]